MKRRKEETLDSIFKSMKQTRNQHPGIVVGSKLRPYPSTEAGIDRASQIVAQAIRSESNQDLKKMIHMYAQTVKHDVHKRRNQQKPVVNRGRNLDSPVVEMEPNTIHTVYEWNDRAIINDRILDWHRWRLKNYPKESVLNIIKGPLKPNYTVLDLYHRCDVTCSGRVSINRSSSSQTSSSPKTKSKTSFMKVSLLGKISSNSSLIPSLIGCIKSGLVHLCRSETLSCPSVKISSDKTIMICTASGMACRPGSQIFSNESDFSNQDRLRDESGDMVEQEAEQAEPSEHLTTIENSNLIIDGLPDPSLDNHTHPENARRIRALRVQIKSLISLDQDAGFAVVNLGKESEIDFSWMWILRPKLRGWVPIPYCIDTSNIIKYTTSNSLSKHMTNQFMKQKNLLKPSPPDANPENPNSRNIFNLLRWERERQNKRQNRRIRRSRAKGIHFSLDQIGINRLQGSDLDNARTVIEAVLDDLLWDGKRRCAVNDMKASLALETSQNKVHQQTKITTRFQKTNGFHQDAAANRPSSSLSSLATAIGMMCKSASKRKHVPRNAWDMIPVKNIPNPEIKIEGSVANIHQLSASVQASLKQTGVLGILRKNGVRHLALTEVILYLWILVAKPVMEQTKELQKLKQSKYGKRKKDPNGRKPSLFQFVLGFLYAASEREIKIKTVKLWPRDWWLYEHLPSPKDLQWYGTKRNELRWKSRFLNPVDDPVAQGDRVEALAQSLDRISRKQNENLHPPRVYCSHDLTVGSNSLIRSLLWYSSLQQPSPQRIGEDLMKHWVQIRDDTASFKSHGFQPVGSFWLTGSEPPKPKNSRSNLTTSLGIPAGSKKKKRRIRLILSHNGDDEDHKKLFRVDPNQKLNCSISAGFYAAAMQGPIFCCLYRTDAPSSTGRIELHLRMRTDIRDMSRLPRHGIPQGVNWKLDTVVGPFVNQHNAFMFLAKWSRGVMSLIMRRMTAVSLAKNNPKIIVWNDGPIVLPPPEKTTPPVITAPPPVFMAAAPNRTSLPGHSKTSPDAMMSEKEFFFGSEIINQTSIPGLQPPQKSLPLQVPQAMEIIRTSTIPIITTTTRSSPPQPLFLGRPGGFSSWGKSIEQM